MNCYSILNVLKKCKESMYFYVVKLLRYFYILIMFNFLLVQLVDVIRKITLKRLRKYCYKLEVLQNGNSIKSQLNENPMN